jgi:thymidylate kinase
MFIVFEGISGSGKTALIRSVKDHLPKDSAGHASVDIEFPSFGRVGVVIRAADRANPAGAPTRPFEPAALLHLGLSDIYDEMPRWDSRIAEGGDILCERYFVWLRVHQIDHHSPYMVDHVCRRAEATVPRPDLYVIINAPPEIAAKRIQIRNWPPRQPPDLDQLQVHADRYLQVSGSLGSWLPRGERGVLVLDGTRDVYELTESVIERVEALQQSDRAA